jgi:hypothetical protein
MQLGRLPLCQLSYSRSGMGERSARRLVSSNGAVVGARIPGLRSPPKRAERTRARRSGGERCPGRPVVSIAVVLPSVRSARAPAGRAASGALATGICMAGVQEGGLASHRRSTIADPSQDFQVASRYTCHDCARRERVARHRLPPRFRAPQTWVEYGRRVRVRGQARGLHAGRRAGSGGSTLDPRPSAGSTLDPRASAACEPRPRPARGPPEARTPQPSVSPAARQSSANAGSASSDVTAPESIVMIRETPASA